MHYSGIAMSKTAFKKTLITLSDFPVISHFTKIMTRVFIHGITVPICTNLSIYTSTNTGEETDNNNPPPKRKKDRSKPTINGKFKL